MYIYSGKTVLTENGSFCLFVANGKRKTEVCFPWSANDKRLLMFAVSANVPIYDSYEH